MDRLFNSKDEILEDVIDLFFSKYKVRLEEIVNCGYRNPFQCLTNFFNYFIRETIKFRAQFEKIDDLLRINIRSKALDYAKPCLETILNILVDWGAKPRLSIEKTAALLCEGVCNNILHEDFYNFDSIRNEAFSSVQFIMGFDKENRGITVPIYANYSDVDACLTMIKSNQILTNFWNIAISRKELITGISNNEIVIIKTNDAIVGLIKFSRLKKRIDFLYFEKTELNDKIGLKLIITALAQYMVGDIITVNIYDKKNELGKKYLDFLTCLGFEPYGEYDDKEYFIKLKRVVPATAKQVFATKS